MKRGFPWKIALGCCGATAAAQALAHYGLQGLRAPQPPWAEGVAAAFILACGLGIWVALASRRAGERAHPVLASMFAWLGLSVLSLAIEVLA